MVWIGVEHLGPARRVEKGFDPSASRRRCVLDRFCSFGIKGSHHSDIFSPIAHFNMMKYLVRTQDQTNHLPVQVPAAVFHYMEQDGGHM